MEAVDIRSMLARLIGALPLHAEENPLREAIPETDLVNQTQSSDEQADLALAVVGVIRRVYEALGLLDPSELDQSRWAFVSFPAALVARSILETLAADGQSFFGPGYWVQGDHQPRQVIEQQRDLLMFLEKQRHDSHSSQPPNPIRTVHVAWGLIRLGGRFLLYAREDKVRPGVKRYVFPGGRLDIPDVPSASQQVEVLRDLACVDSAIAIESLPRTLSRELDEELGLSASEYSITFERRLGPHAQLEGTSNKYSYSVYNIHIWWIQLTREGEMKVLDLAARNPESFPWFTAAEIASGRRSDGLTAFVDALHQDVGTELEVYLSNDIRDSSTTPPTHRNENDTIELPDRAGEPIFRGKTGKQKATSIIPNEQEWELLMILGWHSRGLPVMSVGNAIVPLNANWLALNDVELRVTAVKLARRLEEAGFPFLETDLAGHCRLSVDRSLVYFHPGLFKYEWRTDDPKKSIVVTLKNLETRWAALDDARCIVTLEPVFNRDLLELVKGGVPKGGDFERSSRAHFDQAKAIGLRQFTAGSKHGPYIVVAPA